MSTYKPRGNRKEESVKSVTPLEQRDKHRSVGAKLRTYGFPDKFESTINAIEMHRSLEENCFMTLSCTYKLKHQNSRSVQGLKTPRHVGRPAPPPRELGHVWAGNGHLPSANGRNWQGHHITFIESAEDWTRA
ncbi:hypothetical protein J6590_069260 [Homalodisca vitripennis]|nr:hypothetical protein J6590_069260 [Homalodisca vitripennis]